MIVFGLRAKSTQCVYYDSKWANFVSKGVRMGLSFDEAASVISEQCCFDESTYYYFLNPLVPNFVDDKHADKIYYVNAVTGALTRFSDNPKLMEKLKYMGFGEALCDSVEVLP